MSWKFKPGQIIKRNLIVGGHVVASIGRRHSKIDLLNREMIQYALIVGVNPEIHTSPPNFPYGKSSLQGGKGAYVIRPLIITPISNIYGWKDSLTDRPIDKFYAEKEFRVDHIRTLRRARELINAK